MVEWVQTPRGWRVYWGVDPYAKVPKVGQHGSGDSAPEQPVRIPARSPEQEPEEHPSSFNAPQGA